MPSMDSWHESPNEDEQKEYFTLLNPQYHEFLAMQVEDVFEQYSRINEVETLDKENKIRKQIAKSQKHGILSLGNSTSGDKSCDIKHGFWSFYKCLIAVMVTVFWCIWGWSKPQIVACIEVFGIPTLVTQVEQYIDNNGTKKIKGKTFSVHIHGDSVNIICNKFARFVLEAEEMCQNPVQRMNLALIWTIVKEMRSVFGVLHISRFSKNVMNSTPHLIKQMINSAKKAYFIAENKMNTLVCVHEGTKPPKQAKLLGVQQNCIIATLQYTKPHNQKLQNYTIC